jgi:prevent-host-death family protein
MQVRERNAKWQLQEAKAMLSQVVKSAAREPQIITVRGEEKVVILSMDEYKKIKPKKQSLFEFLQNSPWSDVELELPERRIDPVRDLNL